MSKCDKCGGKGYILVDDFISLPIMLKPVICPSCSDNIEEVKQTNADKIRSMSDEELSKFLHDLSYDFINEHYLHELFTYYTSYGQDAHLCYVEWLKSEVNNGN